MQKIINMFIIKGNTLQTVSNIIFLASIIIAFICLLICLSEMKKNNNSSFANLIMSVCLMAFAFTYNSNEHIFDIKYSNIMHLILLGLVVIVSIITLIKQLFKKPHNGHMVIKTENDDGEIEMVEISGKQYEKEFNRRKRRHIVLNAIRNILMIASCLSITLVSSYVFDSLYKYLVDFRLNGAVVASMSIYSIMFIVGIVIALIIGWIIRKLDNIY